MIFFTILILFVGVIIKLNARDKEIEEKRKAEREAYLKTPEGIAEQARLEEDRRQLDIRLKEHKEQVRAFEAAYRFKNRVHHCWKCKRKIQLPAEVNFKDTSLRYYYGVNDEERNERYKKIKEVICPTCGWVKCQSCQSCKCGSIYSNNR